jgi:hypothetical protein
MKRTALRHVAIMMSLTGLAGAKAPADPNAAPPTTPAAQAPDDANAKLEKALTELKDNAEKEKDNAAGDLASLRNGNLMSRGLTGGVAFALQVPIWELNGVKVNNWNVTTMPYVMILPGFWGVAQATREACAAAHGAGTETDARIAATAVTRQTAEALFAAMMDQFDTLEKRVPTPTAEEMRAEIIALLRLEGVYGGDKTVKVKVEDNDKEVVVNPTKNIVDSAANYRKTRSPEDKATTIDLMAKTEWSPALKPICWTRQIGAWIGYPLAFDATTTIGGAEAEREVSPLVAFGVGVSPHQHVSLLWGVSLGNVRQEADSSEKTTWSMTFAAGGNLDILTSLLK